MRAASRQTELGAALAAAIAANGPITFADYMQIALYHPQGGYYTNPDHTPQGWEGDYITSSDVHPLFGAALGRQLAQIWELLGNPAPFNVLEVGAGRGHLARDIQVWAGDAASDAPQGFTDALRYTMRDVGERPPPLAPSLRESLATDARSRPRLRVSQLTPFSPLRSENEEGEIVSMPHVILSNELIDAFPVHVVERSSEGLQEVYVDSPDGAQLVERLGPISAPEVGAYLAKYGVQWERLPAGWRAEVNLAAERWLADAARELGSQGVILTIDYGDVARRLYSRDRRRGTLMGYYRHELSENPLALTGQQDLTAHVNFSALIAEGREYSLRLAGLVTQREFLLALGLCDDARALGQKLYPLADTERYTDAGQRDYLRRANLMNAINVLIDPHGMGGFRVLVQQRGLPGAGKVLRGLQRNLASG